MALPVDTDVVGAAGAFVVVEVMALLAVRDPFWGRPLATMTTCAEVAAIVASFVNAGLLLAPPFAGAFSADPAWAAALGLLTIGLLAADIRRYEGTTAAVAGAASLWVVAAGHNADRHRRGHGCPGRYGISGISPYTRRRMLRRKPILLVAALVALFPACGSRVSSAYRSHLPTSAGPARADGDIAISGAGYDLQAVGTVAPGVADGAWKSVLTTLDRYIEAGVLVPLRSGGPAGDLGPLFTAGAAARVTSPGPDRSAFIDEGLPPAKNIRSDVAAATLTGLAGSDGKMSVVSARLDLRLRAEVDGAPLVIARTGELVLRPEGDTWRIDGYDIHVSRDTTDARTTTTARSA